jgi:hypothetical protein
VPGASVAKLHRRLEVELRLRAACFRDPPRGVVPLRRTRMGRSTSERHPARRLAVLAVDQRVDREVDLAEVRGEHLAEDQEAPLVVDRAACVGLAFPDQVEVDAECRRGRGSSWRRTDSDLLAIPREPVRQVPTRVVHPEAPRVVARTDSAVVGNPAAEVAHLEELPTRAGARMGPARAEVRRVPGRAEVHNHPVAAAAAAAAAAVEVDPNPAVPRPAADRGTSRDAERPRRAGERHTKRRTYSWACSKCRNAGTRSFGNLRKSEKTRAF